MPGPGTPQVVMANVPAFSTLRMGYRAPGEVAGQVGPGVYYLSPLANVPFVTFVGAEGYEKTISWGESFKTPPNTGLVRVKNGSYHSGEIVLGTGEQASYPMPARITVPVLPSSIDGSAVYPPNPGNPPFSAVVYTARLDTRRARRAYLMGDAKTLTDAIGIQVVGQAIERFTLAPATASFPGYSNTMTVLANTEFRRVPLGYGADMSENNNEPHALLDVVTRVAFGTVSSATIQPLNIWAFYVLEYV